MSKSKLLVKNNELTKEYYENKIAILEKFNTLQSKHLEALMKAHEKLLNACKLFLNMK